MDTSKRDIAERFARLPAEKQIAFLEVLRRQGIDFARLPIVPASPAARARLSHAQARQWFLWRLDPASTAYHIPGALKLKGALDVQALRDSFAALVARHESLRTVFRPQEDGLAEQAVLPHMALDIPLAEPEGDTRTAREADIARAASQLAARPFDLSTGPLLRAALFRLADDEHVLAVVMHHIVSDGWSMQVLVQEFSALYSARLQGTVPDLPALPIQYADHAAWQRHWLEAGEQQRQLAYWQAQLGDEHPVLQLPTDHPRRPDGRYQSARHLMALPPALARALHAQRQAWESLTLFMQLLAGFQILLHRYTGQQDIRVGAPSANRQRPETQGLIGFFVNTQVLRQVVHARQPLADVLAGAREAVLGAQAHQDLPFEQLVEALQPERSRGANPLFQVLFNHQRGDSRAMARQLPGLLLENHALDEQAAQFELTLSTVEDADGRIHVGLAYAAELFDAATVARMAGHYGAVLDALAGRPGQAVGDVNLLDPPQRGQLDQWGQGAGPAPASCAEARPIHELVEAQGRRRPGAVAVVAGTEVLSYGQLNARANRLAHWLIAQGVGPDSRVGLAAGRGADTVVALLAILKAGGAYVALETDYPAERLRYLVRDSGIGLLLTEPGVDAGFVPEDLALPVWGLAQPVLGHWPDSDPGRQVSAEALAYATYTSGSTGQPKGVLITHRGVHRLVHQASYARLDEDVRMLQFAPLAFDASTFEIWGSLCHGGVLVCAPPGKPTLDELGRLIAAQRVNTAWLTAALFNHMVDDHAPALAGVRQLLTGGEAMSGPHALRAQAALPDTRLINGDGPTECTTFAACHEVTARDLGHGLRRWARQSS